MLKVYRALSFVGGSYRCVREIVLEIISNSTCCHSDRSRTHTGVFGGPSYPLNNGREFIPYSQVRRPRNPRLIQCQRMEDVTRTKRFSTVTLIGVVVVLALIAGLLLSLSNIAKQQRMYAISTFQECKDAGYPIMESYPEQCATSDGRTFVNEMQEPVTSGTPSPGASLLTSNGCAVSGCSGQLCISEDEARNGGGVSTCEFRSEYACYREASCEPQANGKCGWTQTSELKKCLANPPALDQTPQAI